MQVFCKDLVRDTEILFAGPRREREKSNKTVDKLIALTDFVSKSMGVSSNRQATGKQTSCERHKNLMSKTKIQTGKSTGKITRNWQACNCTVTRRERCGNGVSDFTVKTSSQCASTKGIVKGHGPCVATQDDIKILAFYRSISELCYPK